MYTRDVVLGDELKREALTAARVSGASIKALDTIVGRLEDSFTNSNQQRDQCII